MRFAITAAAAAPGVGCIGFAADAVAAPTGVGSAADTVKSLEADGYTVQINGAATVLSECTVTGCIPAPRSMST